jgi:hypothetical protein
LVIYADSPSGLPNARLSAAPVASKANFELVVLL